MNKTINEIINNYTSGKTPVEDTNKALKKAGAGFSFQPGKNALTAEEIAATHVGPRPNDATGYGLMSSGTSTMDKVHVVKGKLQGGAVNTVGSDGMPNECDIVYIGGQVWQVYGDELGNLAPERLPGGPPCTPSPAQWHGKRKSTSTSPKRIWCTTGPSITARKW